MKRLTPIITTLALLALAASAQAAVTKFTIRGAGFGHGIGLSQYGAYGWAVQGAEWRKIVLHYYKGTRLGNAGGRTIRVLMQSGVSSVYVSGATRIADRRLNPGTTYRLMRGGINRVELRTVRGKKIDTFEAPATVASSRGSFVLGGRALNGLSGGRYRGALEVRPGLFGGVTAVNALPLDDYIQGVIVGEVPTSWPMQVLQAQSVVARSYALVTDAGGAIFDQYPDTRSQMYYGMSRETQATNQAVRSTAGQVVMYGDRVASTYYFSTSGGRTENIENSWPGSNPVAYLKSVEDPYDKASPYHRWRQSYSRRGLDAKLGGWVKGTLRSVKVTRRGVSPRIVQAQIVGSRGSTTVTGPQIRARLGLRDTWAYFVAIGSEQRDSEPNTAAEDDVLADEEATSGGGATASRFRKTGRTVPRKLVVAGTVSPRPKKITLQQRVKGGWKTIGYGKADARGRYALIVKNAGSYRILAAGGIGPTVRVR